MSEYAPNAVAAFQLSRPVRGVAWRSASLAVSAAFQLSRPVRGVAVLI